jgi:hypothetical protein
VKSYASGVDKLVACRVVNVTRLAAI